MPDILDKDQVLLEPPAEFNLGEWLGKKSHQLESVQAVVDKTLAEIKKDFSEFEVKIFEEIVLRGWFRSQENWSCRVLLWRQICDQVVGRSY